MKQLKNSNFILVSSTISREKEYEKYLFQNVKTFAIVAIAPLYSKNAHSQCRLYEQGKVVKKIYLYCIQIPHSLLHFRLLLIPLAHISRAISIIYSFLRMKRKFDIYLGADYFYTIIGLLLQRMKLVDKVIYYCGDYFPLPTKIGVYTLFNKIAQLIDRFCANRCDIVWNASPAIIEIKRRKKIITIKSPPQIVVPTGIDINKIYQKSLSQIDATSIGFIGVIGNFSGLDLLLEALSEIKEEIPTIKLNIIGSGPSEKRLRDIVQKKGIGNHVTFWGFVADETKVKEILSNCAIGIAPYVPDVSSFTQYTEPGKVMEYLTLGLPVVVTKVPRIAFEIESHRAGFAIEYSKEELKTAILKILTNRELLKEYRENALQMALDYDWKVILNKAWSESPMLFGSTI